MKAQTKSASIALGEALRWADEISTKQGGARDKSGRALSALAAEVRKLHSLVGELRSNEHIAVLYEEALIASEEIGCIGMTPAQTIRHLAAPAAKDSTNVDGRTIGQLARTDQAASFERGFARCTKFIESSIATAIVRTEVQRASEPRLLARVALGERIYNLSKSLGIALGLAPSSETYHARLAFALTRARAGAEGLNDTTEQEILSIDELVGYQKCLHAAENRLACALQNARRAHEATCFNLGQSAQTAAGSLVDHLSQAFAAISHASVDSPHFNDRYDMALSRVFQDSDNADLAAEVMDNASAVVVPRPSNRG